MSSRFYQPPPTGGSLDHNDNPSIYEKGRHCEYSYRVVPVVREEGQASRWLI